MFDLVQDETGARALGLAPQQASPGPGRNRLSHIALIGNYPPRQCGIATFTADLYAAIANTDPRLKIDVVAMNDDGFSYDYGDRVDVSIDQGDVAQYISAARRLNDSRVELVCVQHEFGIFGGSAGENLLVLLDNLRCPVVTAFHTVLDQPDPDQSRVVAALLRRSARVIVMAERGRQILLERYNAPPEKVVVIPHGAPDFPFVDPNTYKRQLDLTGREVLLTFGLLSPNKGVESVIRALPEIVKARPDVTYVVLGATHPTLVRREGEAYRERLMALAEECGVREHVRFVNTYVTAEDLLEYLAAADVYVTPYLSERQITSGTLSYAVALGKPVVSTPYWHAAELLANDVGVLVDFGDSAGFAAALTDLLTHPRKRAEMAMRAYKKGRETIWARSGERHIAAMEDAVRQSDPAAPRKAVRVRAPELRAVFRMSDSCGMLQHGIYSIADRAHGYCTDDNARALMFMVRAGAAGLHDQEIDRFTPIYASFLAHAWNEPKGRFRNFMSYERRWLEEVGSEDSFGRALWAIGETARLAEDNELRRWALSLADRVVPHVTSIPHSHALSFSVLGLAALANYRRGQGAWQDAMLHCLTRLKQDLADTRRPGWTWFHDVLSYDNARLAQAMIAAGMALDDRDAVRDGAEALRWLASIQQGPSGCFSPIGNESFGQRFSHPAVFDQQPLEATAMIEACWTAADALGDEPFWRAEAERAYAWFFGDNVLGVRIAAADGAGCHDGLGACGTNRNQGAESILALQFANCVMKTRTQGRERGTPAR